jgi:hypothetical protein
MDRNAYWRIFSTVMTMKRPSHSEKTRSARVMLTLPKSLAAEVEEYAGILRQGNKSGFVADAIRSYIGMYRKLRHTRRLRESYAASARKGLTLDRKWEETWGPS